jgi:hypothetical protein
LTEVELHHDLHEIGVRSFFFGKALTQVHVSDGVRALEEARSPVVNLLISEILEVVKLLPKMQLSWQYQVHYLCTYR